MPRPLSWKMLAVYASPRGQVIAPLIAEGPAVSVAQTTRVNRANRGRIRVIRRPPTYLFLCVTSGPIHYSPAKRCDMPERTLFFVCRTMPHGAAVRVITPVGLQVMAMQAAYRFDQYRYRAAAIQVQDGWYFRPIQLLPHRKG